MLASSAGNFWGNDTSRTNGKQEAQTLRSSTRGLQRQLTQAALRQNQEIKTVSIKGSDGVTILDLKDLKGFFIDQDNFAKDREASIKNSSFGEYSANALALWMNYFRGRETTQWFVGALSAATIKNASQLDLNRQIQYIELLIAGIKTPQEVKIQGNTLVIKLKKPAADFKVESDIANYLSEILQSSLVHTCNHVIGINCHKIASNQDYESVSEDT